MNKSDTLTVCLDDMSDICKHIDILCFTDHNIIPGDICYLRKSRFDIAAWYARQSRDGGILYISSE